MSVESAIDVWVFVVNLTGVDECFKYCVESMLTDGGGHIVKENVIGLSPGNDGGETKFVFHRIFFVNHLSVYFLW